jgi:hypothetical protein
MDVRNNSELSLRGNFFSSKREHKMQIYSIATNVSKVILTKCLV